jgi:hypothetical protein
LRELQVVPGGATIEVGQSVALTAVPIELFPEQPVTAQVIAGMSFQWVSNEPGFASVAGSGRNASVTGLKAGTINVMCITEQAMGLATIIIKDTTKVDNAAAVNDDDAGFKDSSDNWKDPDKGDDDTGIPDAPPEPPEDDEKPIDTFDDQRQAYDQQQFYDEQQQREQALLDQQRQMQLLSMFGNLASQIQGLKNNHHSPQSVGGIGVEGGQVLRSPYVQPVTVPGPTTVVSGGTAAPQSVRKYCPKCGTLLPAGAQKCNQRKCLWGW